MSKLKVNRYAIYNDAFEATHYELRAGHQVLGRVPRNEGSFTFTSDEGSGFNLKPCSNRIFKAVKANVQSQLDADGRRAYTI